MNTGDSDNYITIRRLVLLGVLLASGCRWGNDRDSAPARAEGAPDQVIENFTVDNFETGRRQWTLTAPKAFVYESENRVDVDRPFIRFFSGGRPGATVESGKGRFFTDTNSLKSWDGVVMVSTDGARVESPFMDYLAKEDLVVSTAPVTVTRGSSVLRGVGWEAKPDLSHMQVRRQTIEYEMPEKKK